VEAHELGDVHEQVVRARGKHPGAFAAGLVDGRGVEHAEP